jgi:hypothetical protein
MAKAVLGKRQLAPRSIKQIQTTEPAVGKIEVNRFAKAPLLSNTRAIAREM